MPRATTTTATACAAGFASGSNQRIFRKRLGPLRKERPFALPMLLDIAKCLKVSRSGASRRKSRRSEPKKSRLVAAVGSSSVFGTKGRTRDFNRLLCKGQHSYPLIPLFKIGLRE